MDSLQYRYNAIISEYLARFAEKQGLELDTDDMQSDFFGFNEGTYIFSINDIRLDIDKDVPAGIIKDWDHFRVIKYNHTISNINYRSWLMVAR